MYLAQMNLAILRHPLDDPRMADFIARLDEINLLAERSPGFVWRFKAEGGHALDIRPYPDERVVVNMSVWEGIEPLFEYTYYSDHVQVFRRRRDWFEAYPKPHQVLWYVPPGHEPTVEEAEARRQHLAEYGPTPHAFDFKHRLPPES
ncbi:MAG: DUF3291 domain-containing protein [Chloroflexi bacterium]|nr:DUF3291 domain-containing protein [Chloroflexota bacterium]